MGQNVRSQSHCRTAKVCKEHGSLCVSVIPGSTDCCLLVFPYMFRSDRLLAELQAVSWPLHGSLCSQLLCFQIWVCGSLLQLTDIFDQVSRHTAPGKTCPTSLKYCSIFPGRVATLLERHCKWNIYFIDSLTQAPAIIIGPKNRCLLFVFTSFLSHPLALKPLRWRVFSLLLCPQHPAQCLACNADNIEWKREWGWGQPYFCGNTGVGGFL